MSSAFFSTQAAIASETCLRLFFFAIRHSAHFNSGTLRA
jgi:hypothetical protein